MKKQYWIIFFISLGNFWFWRMLESDFIVAILCLILSILLWLGVIRKASQKIVIIALLIFLLISAISLWKGSDRGIFITQPLENDLIEKRHEYFAKELGRAYKNRIGVYYLKTFSPQLQRLEKNFFAGLDINLYFFASHPRERVGVAEFEKYPFILLPFFILGVINFLSEKQKYLFFYLIAAMFVSTFLHPTYILGPVLFYPPINVFISSGVMISISFLKIFFRKK